MMKILKEKENDNSCRHGTIGNTDYWLIDWLMMIMWWWNKNDNENMYKTYNKNITNPNILAMVIQQ